MQQSRVSIRFTSLSNLWYFRLAINANIFEMNLSQLTITCECTSEQVQMALEQYKGKVVELKKVEVESWSNNAGK